MTGDIKSFVRSWLDRSRFLTCVRMRIRILRIRGFSFRKLLEIEARAKQSEAWKALEIEAAKRRSLDFGDPQDALKYLHIDFWLRENVIRAAALGLHRAPSSLKVLDLGTGSGLFPFVCSLLGHRASALDKPFDRCRPAEISVYTVMPAVLGVEVHRASIKAFEPIALGETYDLITAFMICFNEHQQPQEWSRDEWEFFLTDLCRHVNPGGRVHLAFNPHIERYGKLRFYDEPILSLLRKWGRIQRGGHITIMRDRVVSSKPRPLGVRRLANIGS